jgi:hypothetical protein
MTTNPGPALARYIHKADNIAYRVAVALALVAALLLVWINLAVGIIGSEDNLANMMYLGVLAVLILGALLARFRSQGTARALFATALSQVLVPLLGLMIWKPEMTSTEALLELSRVVGVTALFVAMWVGSALLFRRANATPNHRPE